MRAERRAGEMLRNIEKSQGAVPGKTGRKGKPVLDAKPKLAHLGINKTQSSRWQKLAALEQDHFEEKVERASKRAYDDIARRFIKAEEVRRAKEGRGKVVEHRCTVADLAALAEFGKRFSVIYADPPWPYENWSPAGGVRTGAANHYETCPIDEILRLPVASLAADDCALLLWCTWPHITMGTHVDVMRAWDFKPSTVAFVWVKKNRAARGCTVATAITRAATLRFASSRPRARCCGSTRTSPIGEHSEKPEEVRRRIERLFPGPYLELYARKPAPAWTVWGNEIPRSQFHKVAK